ncbi:Rho GTPase activation protein [Gongronella butleri]|nr:Rho GTPase activation protein [Gongronella butleri]
MPLSTSSPEYKGISELNIIFEAGLDEDSRPILVLCAHRLPDPAVIDYDLILADEFVESDYVLVFFSAPARYRPSWWWLLKAYRALDRRYKKNLKALYVLHLTRSYRIIFDLANRITSPKFAKKLHYVSSLDDLKLLVRLPATMIPEAVADYDKAQPVPASTFKLNQVTPTPAVSLAFGRSLPDLAALEGWTASSQPAVPAVVRQLIEHLTEHGLEKEGLFRKSPSSEELHTVKKQFNYGQAVDLNEHDVDVSAALLKVFLRDLPTPVITVDQSLALASTLSAKPDESQLQQLREHLASTFKDQVYEWSLLRYLVPFLGLVAAHADANRMTPHNLAVVFTPNLIRAQQSTINLETAMASQELAMQTATLYLKQMDQGIRLLEVLITYHASLF